MPDRTRQCLTVPTGLTAKAQLYVWATRGPFGRLTKSLCDFGDMTPHTLVGGAQTTHSRQRLAFGRIVETTQGRPWGLEGTPSPGPQGLWTGARGSQGPSGRPTTRGTPLLEYTVLEYDREGVNVTKLGNRG